MSYLVGMCEEMVEIRMRGVERDNNGSQQQQICSVTGVLEKPDIHYRLSYDPHDGLID